MGVVQAHSKPNVAMKYAVQINAGPLEGRATEQGVQFIKTAIASGDEIVRVFFYQDGVRHAFAGDTANVAGADWSRLGREAGLELVFCTAAAERRGLYDPACGQGGDAVIREGFVPGGLGAWVDACLKADRVLVFDADAWT
ncbi:sulfurtransferase complex subunit TusD [Methyloparacoccus murrellii]